MGIIRFKEIVEMSPEDRQKKLVDLRAEQSRLRTMIKAGGAVENPTKVREIRRTIAQILTVENEIKLGIGKHAKKEEEEKPKKKVEKKEKNLKTKKEAEEIKDQ